MCSHSSSPKDYNQIVLETTEECHHAYADQLKIAPQLFSLASINNKIHDFIAKSELLKDNLTFSVNSTYMNNIQSFSNEGSSVSIEGLKEYAIKNPSIDKVKIN